MVARAVSGVAEDLEAEASVEVEAAEVDLAASGAEASEVEVRVEAGEICARLQGAGSHN